MQRTMYEREQERLESRRHPSGSVWAEWQEDSRPWPAEATDEEFAAFQSRCAEADARAEALRAAEASCPAPRDVEGVGRVHFAPSRTPGRWSVYVGAGDAPELVGYTDQPASDEAVQAVYDRFCEECE